MSNQIGALLSRPIGLDWPAILVNLERIDPQELRERLIEAWCRKAPKDLVREFKDQLTA